jgi:TRAP-type C4-dicarboxylate transport system permease small subunit
MTALRLVAGLSRLCGGLAAAAFFFIGLIVSYEVVMRYVFAAPTRWVEETAGVLQIYAVFLACAWLVARREHIRITVLSDCLPPRLRLWLARAALLAVAASAASAAWFTVGLVRFSIAMGQYTDTTLALPMWLLQAPVAAGLALAACQALATLAASFARPDVLDAGETLEP